MTAHNIYTKRSFGRNGDRVYKIVLRNHKVVSFAWKFKTEFTVRNKETSHLPIWSDELTSLFNFGIYETQLDSNYIQLPYRTTQH
jgi:hypothetical protein